MKIRSLLLLPIILSGAGLASCGQDAKINIQYGQTIKNDVDYISYDELASMFSGEKTFMVTVYAQTCSCWSMFHSVVNQYIAENHVRVYAINYNDFHSESGKSLDNFGLNIESGYTSFAIVENGKLKVNLKSGTDKLFKNLESFKSFMSEKIVLPKIFYISLMDLHELYESKETSLVYFARSNCGDCGYFDKYVLDSYKVQNNMYILDCETIGIREYDSEGHLTPESQLAWNNFKIQNYLANNYNPDYGFDTGFVPTLLLLKGNEETHTPTILSGSVYFNDSLSEVDGKLKVTSTYYTNERVAKLEYLNDFNGTKVLEGLEVSKDDAVKYGENYYWDQDAAAVYHTPIVKKFLDYSLSKVTHTTFDVYEDD